MRDSETPFVRYKIVRFFHPSINRRNHGVTRQTGLTLEEAQEHCRDPRTRKEGEWFDGYTQEGG